MTVFEYDGKLLVVDCGVLFPDENQPGVDLILPDFQLIRDRLDDIVAVVLTHGHEDHIGGLSYLLRERGDIPGHRLAATLALLEGKLKEHRHRNVPQQTVVEGEKLQIGRSFASSSRSTTRSRTRWRWRSGRRPARCCTPATSRWTSCRWTTGSPTCARSPGSARRASTCSWSIPPTPRCPVSPPTSATSPRCWTGSSPMRGTSASSSPCFASHVHRVQQVMDAAVKHRRKVAYVGRSMVRNMGGGDLGFLNVPGDTLIDMRELDNYPPEQVVLVSTGSQGEPMSALSRIAPTTTTSSRSSRATPSYSRRP